MRKLILTRGAPGSGKSSLLQRCGLAPFALSMDLLRQVRAAPEMLPNGHLGISQEHNAAVAMEYRARVEERLRRGDLLALDHTMPTQAELDGWLELARAHRYDVLVADFSAMPLDQVKAQNRQREPIRQVPDAAIERIHRLLGAPVAYGPAQAVACGGAASADAERAIADWLDVPVRDFSAYRAVVHIGDLQGCLTVLTGPGGPLEHGFQDDVAYIFVGDLLDRGVENGALFRWFHAEASPRPNVFLLWGNHEDHLHRWSVGLPPVSPDFRDRTLPQLLGAGATPAMALEVCGKALDVLPYTWRGTRVMACHAGLSSVPNRFADISSHQYARGTGHWEDPVDDQFERHAPGDWFQVHGHRNHGAVAVRASARSFNLEDAVEFGGNLRTVTLDERGWTPSEHRNTVFLPARQASKHRRSLRTGAPPTPLADVPPAWMDRPSETRMDDSTLAAMRAHAGVRERASALAPHVAALNFTKDVFFQASWDAVLIKARGLFVNKQTQEIVARGYEKFFNVGERPETQVEALSQTLQWPVSAYVKENGYLGNLGYDAETGDLFVASKSTPDGDFAAWFREIFETTVPAPQRERLRRWLRDNEASMVFEVIDPVRDPHMIDYERPHLVLLDVFHRSSHPEKLPYEHLKAVGERFGLAVKRRAMEFRTPQAFAGWLAAASSDLTWRFKNEDIEGLVLEDRAGFQTKVKLPHYAFWKRMRSAKERLAKLQSQLEEMADDGTLAQKEALLREMDEHKAVVKRLQGEGPAAEVAKARLADLGAELRLVNGVLAGRERRERVVEQMQDTVMRDSHPLAQAFLRWCTTQPANTVAERSILQLRSAFIAETQPDPALWQRPWAAFEQESEAPVPASAPSRRARP